MKNIINKSLLVVFIGLAILSTSCTKNFESINTPPEGATDASTAAVFNALVSSLPLTSGEYSVMNSWLYQITQLGMGASAYPFDNAGSAVWDNYYQTLANYRMLQNTISTSADSSKMSNLSAMIKTIMAYKTFKATNYFGDMPYYQAGYAPLDGASGYVAPFDKQSDIYTSILSDLDWAVDNFTTDTTGQFQLGAYETFFQNDISEWIQFANSLRLYIAVTMYDKNTTLAAAEIVKSMSKPFLDDDNNVGLWPSKISGLEFQWRTWSFSANCYLRMGTTVWNWMSSSNDTTGADIFDPRCKIYYEPDNYGGWVPNVQNPSSTTASDGGAPYNTQRSTDWTNKGAGCLVSPFNYYFEQDQSSIPELILTAAQVHFLKAEVYNRGLGVSANAASAQTEYNKGITASLNMWTGIAYNSSVWVENKPAAATATSSQITTLQTNPKVAYDLSNTSHALSQIYAQLWLDFYRQPGDAWTLMRRTGNATPMSTDNAQGYTSAYGGYQRFVYPDDEKTYNMKNWEAETGGNDVTSTKLWFAK